MVGSSVLAGISGFTGSVSDSSGNAVVIAGISGIRVVSDINGASVVTGFTGREVVCCIDEATSVVDSSVLAGISEFTGSVSDSPGNSVVIAGVSEIRVVSGINGASVVTAGISVFTGRGVVSGTDGTGDCPAVQSEFQT